MDLANPLIAYLGVFLAGLIASGSPCVLVTIPLVIGYVGGYAEGDIRRSFWYAFVFSLGLAVTFTILGVLAAMTGSLVGNPAGIWKYILSAVLIVMGLQMTDVIRLNLPRYALPRIDQRGILGALLLGLLFGVFSSPCATPVLAVILAYVASKRNPLYGVSLLFVYALAHTFLIFLVGVSTGAAEAVFRSRRVKDLTQLSYKISGALFVLSGIFVMFYYR